MHLRSKRQYRTDHSKVSLRKKPSNTNNNDSTLMDMLDIRSTDQIAVARINDKGPNIISRQRSMAWNVRGGKILCSGSMSM